MCIRDRNIPIHTSSEENDYWFSPHIHCNSLSNDKEESESTIRRINNNYLSFYNKLNVTYNLTVTSITDIYELYENIVSAIVNDVKLNINITNEDLATLREATLRERMEVFLRSKLKVKYLGQTMLNDMRKYFMSADEIPQKMALFLVSDEHFYALRKMFTLNVTGLVPFASSLIFELTKIDGQDKKVKAIYNGKRLDLGEKKNFKEFMEHLNRSTFATEAGFAKSCLSLPPSKYDIKKYNIIALIVFFIFLLIWGGSWVMVLHSKKKKPFERVPMASRPDKAKNSLDGPDTGGIFDDKFFNNEEGVVNNSKYG
eukprot:TRINITY_DN12312_c0_g1_i4.p1 TRINITY_DN12312_c0_g1~~TRINITY_DN12312_c0_g1_i4.p1  ORF type:complete len:314 (+),score=74.43 TRINITY_DN12312_c0_g1_i4:73-1014(+)